VFARRKYRVLNLHDLANCAGANPAFHPVASGGDGDSVQFWFVGVDTKLGTIIVSHQGTDPSEM
jgi:hypothetical protein